MQKVQARSISFEDVREKLFWFLSVGVVVLFVLYVYIVSKTILNVVDRKTAEQSIKDVNSSISELESQYISLGQDINLAYAESQGFKEIAKIDYVSRAQTLTMRDNVSR
jgi:ABC-type Na+ efflux pump permease subunit